VHFKKEAAVPPPPLLIISMNGFAWCKVQVSIEKIFSVKSKHTNKQYNENGGNQIIYAIIELFYSGSYLRERR